MKISELIKILKKLEKKSKTEDSFFYKFSIDEVVLHFEDSLVVTIQSKTAP